MKTKQPRSTFGLGSKKLIAFVLCAGLSSLSLPTASRAVQGPPPRLKSESQLKSEAALYDAAMREISQVLNMSLATIDDLKKVKTILERQIPNLRYNRSKLAAMGLSDSTFINAAKARTRDTKATEDFANELVKGASAIFKLDGATSLADRMGRSLDTDTATLRRVAERLKQAAGEIKAKLKAHHALAHYRTVPSVMATSAVASPIPGLTKDQQAVLIIGVAAIACSPLLPLVVTVSQPVIAAALVGQLIANFGTEDGRDKIATCMDDAKKRCRSCAADGAKLCCGFDLIAESLCIDERLLECALCLVS